MKTGSGYVIGRRHAAEPDEEMRLCQDFSATYQDDDVTIIAVADGKAGRNTPQAAVAAARANVSTMIAFLRAPSTWRIAEKNDFKNTALDMLDSALETAAAGGDFDYSELRATVSAVAVRTNGEFLAISIGDGTIVALDPEMNPSVLIPPFREGPRNHTVYTNDLDSAREHMAAWGGTLAQSNFVAFAAFTDGADYLTRRLNEGADILRTAAACTLFGSGDAYIREAIGEIAESHSRDDVSLAIVIDENPALYATAKTILLESRAAKEEAERAAAKEKAAEEAETAAEEIAVPEEILSEKVDEMFTVKPEEPAAEEELPNPPMPTEEPPLPVSDTDPTPAELVVLRAVYAQPLSAKELVDGGYIRQGRVLESVLPLLRDRKIRYEDGKFRGN